jgi:hypothetical protein
MIERTIGATTIFCWVSQAQPNLRAITLLNNTEGGDSMAKIFRSSVINALIDEVWARIRDFNARPVTNGH